MTTDAISSRRFHLPNPFTAEGRDVLFQSLECIVYALMCFMPLMAYCMMRSSILEDMIFSDGEPARKTWETLTLVTSAGWLVPGILIFSWSFANFLRYALRPSEVDVSTLATWMTWRIVAVGSMFALFALYNGQAASDLRAMRADGATWHATVFGPLVRVDGSIKQYGGAENPASVWMVRPAADALLR